MIMAMAGLLALAQPRYDYAHLCMEKLDRGVVAVRQADGGVFVSWRLLKSDPEGVAFDIYRNGEKINAEPLTKGTWFVDKKPIEGATYEVRGDGNSQTSNLNPQISTLKPQPSNLKPQPSTLKPHPSIGYLTIPLQKPDEMHTANDASVGDVDGDGQYEIILKWEPWNAHDNSHDGVTGVTFLDCYRLNGEHLWRIDLGKNIRSGAHYTPFIVYDLDGDGRAELMVKTADGTRDALGRVIGDSTADYRNMAGRILEGPEYISVFNGMTGAVMDTKPYIPERGNVSDWGDNRGNRSERYLAAVGYLGKGKKVKREKGKKVKEEKGKKVYLPSAVFCRGYYTRTVLAAWDWDGQELKQRWVFDTNMPEWASYAGQGNHNLRVADVDGDGLDEITYGSMAVDHDGRGLYNTNMGHGDALHLVVGPNDGRLYIWDCHENKHDGSELRDAKTGETIFQVTSNADVGRCMAADIDPRDPGAEMWSIDSRGVRDMQGNVLENINPRGLSINFGIWWDGDLQRELLDRCAISKYDWENNRVVTLQQLDGLFNNGTKQNPCLSADILGDWREEVLIRNRESTELRLYVSTIPTDFRMPCLMQDIPYRLSVATENVGYNQPPEMGETMEKVKK